MKKELDDLIAFHKKFGTFDKNNTSDEYYQKRINFRYQIMQEELDEYLDAAQRKDKTLIAKEICDLLYTVYGTVIEHDLVEEIEACFSEVHTSNMSKDVGPEKAIKGPNYKPADLSKIIS